jgi:hypothetical protein
MERQLAAWEATRQGAPAPPVMELWGMLSLSTLGTSAAESLNVGPLMAEPHLTRPRVIQERMEAKALAVQQQIEKARDEARSMVANASQWPVDQRLVGALAGQAGSPTQRTDVAEQVQLRLEPAAAGVPSHSSETPSSSAANGGAEPLSPVTVASAADGAQQLADAGPGAGLPALPSPAVSQLLQQGELDLVSAAAIEAAPTPAPRRPARIRSVYDLEPTNGSSGSSSRPGSQAGRGDAGTRAPAPSPFEPRRNRSAAPAAQADGGGRP